VAPSATNSTRSSVRALEPRDQTVPPNSAPRSSTQPRCPRNPQGLSADPAGSHGYRAHACRCTGRNTVATHPCRHPPAHTNAHGGVTRHHRPPRHAARHIRNPARNPPGARPAPHTSPWPRTPTPPMFHVKHPQHTDRPTTPIHPICETLNNAPMSQNPSISPFSPDNARLQQSNSEKSAHISLPISQALVD